MLMIAAGPGLLSTTWLHSPGRNSWVAHLPGWLNGGQCLFEAVGAKQSYQSDKEVDKQLQGEVLLLNGSPEPFFMLQLFRFHPKSLRGSREFT